MLTKTLLILGVFILLVVVVGLVVGYVISAPRYTGPMSDHFDGRDFFTPGAPSPKGFREVIGWQLNRERTQPWGAFHTDPPARVSARPRVGWHGAHYVRKSLDGVAPVRWVERANGPHLRKAGQPV